MFNIFQDHQKNNIVNSNVKEGVDRRIEFDYLRLFAVILVLLHHAILAYATFAFINIENPIATFSPVVDENRWSGFDLIVLFNDKFFMPLLFLISGLFVWQNLKTKGAWKYLSDRLKRLGIPFVIVIPLLIPLAYYPAQLEVGLITKVEISYFEFWFQMIRNCFGTAGPLWFVWLLLSFDCLVTLLYRFCPPVIAIKKFASNITNQPIVFFGILIAISTLAYLPMMLCFGPHEWVGLGPFIVQASRILFYLVYFFAGLTLGAAGFEHNVFKADGLLAKRWWVWLATSLILNIVSIAILVSAKDLSIVNGFILVLCCAATVFGFIGLFLRYAKRSFKIINNLSKNSYGIFLVHYVFVTWFQYLLLESSLAPSLKGMIVFAATLVFSWGTVATMRRVPIVAKVI